MIKARSKGPSQHKKKCHKESCSGAENRRQNYLSMTSRNASPISKKKPSKNKKRNAESLKILKQSYMQLKVQNEQLLKKLSTKKRKVDELKEKLMNCQIKLAIVQKTQQFYNGERGSQERPSVHKKCTEVISASQNLTKQTFERYRILEEEFTNYKTDAGRKISKLMKEKDETIINDHRQNRQDREVEQLRKQMKRLRQEQLTATSLKNIGVFQQTTDRDRSSTLSKQNLHLKQSLDSLKLQVKRLQVHNQNLQNQLRTSGLVSKGREDELRANLDLINERVCSWEEEYKHIQQGSIQWELRYGRLCDRYQSKKSKMKRNNTEWAALFKELVFGIDKLKDQLESVSAKNFKLIKMCSPV